VGSIERSLETVRGLWQRIEALGLAGRIVLAGDVDERGLEEHYAQSDVFVLPTHYEGYGMALAEALAHGLPVVSPTAGAVPDTVPPAAGLLVPPGDPEALAAALALVMDDAQLRRRLARGSRAAWPRCTRGDHDCASAIATCWPGRPETPVVADGEPLGYAQARKVPTVRTTNHGIGPSAGVRPGRRRRATRRRCRPGPIRTRRMAEPAPLSRLRSS
jgi:hypothetical protein